MENQVKKSSNSNQAIVEVLGVSVKAIRIDRKQMSQSVFRQIINEPIIDEETAEFKGQPWCTVNYFFEDCVKGTHYHVVWLKGDELRRECVWNPNRRQGDAIDRAQRTELRIREHLKGIGRLYPAAVLLKDNTIPQLIDHPGHVGYKTDDEGLFYYKPQETQDRKKHYANNTFFDAYAEVDRLVYEIWNFQSHINQSSKKWVDEESGKTYTSIPYDYEIIKELEDAYRREHDHFAPSELTQQWKMQNIKPGWHKETDAEFLDRMSLEREELMNNLEGAAETLAGKLNYDSNVLKYPASIHHAIVENVIELREVIKRIKSLKDAYENWYAQVLELDQYFIAV